MLHPPLLRSLLLTGAFMAFTGVACADRAVVPGVASDSVPTAPAAPPSTATPLPSPKPSPSAGPNAPPSADGPWNRDLVLYSSEDGLTFSNQRTLIERAGVPDVIRDSSGRLIAVFQWFPFDNRDAFDRVAVAFSSDEGETWSKPVQVQVSGMPANLIRPFDPTIVQLPDGRFRLYFTSRGQGQGELPGIYSAISSDAAVYQFEDGPRFAPEGGTVDASVVFYQAAWHLFSHNQKANTGQGFHAVSQDGLAFTRLAEVDAGQGRQWIGNAVVTDGVLRYYGSGRDGVWIASSKDGSAWTIVGTGPSAGDPCALRLPSGRTLLIAVGPPRADAGPRPN